MDGHTLCATFVYTEGWPRKTKIEADLKQGFSEDSMGDFLALLDFEYSDSTGPHLFGAIWYADGTWSERTYDDFGARWEYRVPPTIPDELQSHSGIERQHPERASKDAQKEPQS